jgi:hypothetical protein
MGPSSRTSSKSGRETGLREYDFVDEMQIDQRLWIVDLASRPKSRRLRAASVVAIAAELHGGVAERLNAPVLKTGDGRPSVGSNPTPSANIKAHLGRSFVKCLMGFFISASGGLRAVRCYHSRSFLPRSYRAHLHVGHPR